MSDSTEANDMTEAIPDCSAAGCTGPAEIAALEAEVKRLREELDQHVPCAECNEERYAAEAEVEILRAARRNALEVAAEWRAEVERLREEKDGWRRCALDEQREYEAEAERLREERDVHSRGAEEFHLALGHAEREIDRLREALVRLRQEDYGRTGNLAIINMALDGEDVPDITAQRADGESR